jgi:hypothetical protein
VNIDENRFTPSTKAAARPDVIVNATPAQANSLFITPETME